VSPLSSRTWDNAVTKDCGANKSVPSYLYGNTTKHLSYEVLGEIREVVWLRDNFAFEYIFFVLRVVAITEEELEEMI
jgi:hypothetical protein